MANRFERLFQLPEKQYAEGSPVILAAGVLSKDTETGSIIAQLKFQSVSEKRIKAVKVSLTAYDISKAEVQGVTDYQYLELNVGNGQEFGSNKAIVMPISVTRSFAVASILVVFSDGSIWESAGNFSVLPAAKSLSFTLGSAEMEKQYRIATNDGATYAPFESQDLWQCSCGTWNKGTTCTHCRLLKSKVFSALDVTTLTEQMNIRLVKEQEQREAEVARQVQLQAKAEVRRKKHKKRLTIVAIIAVIAAILLTVGIVIYNKLTELTIEKLLSLYTQDDVTSLLGKPDNAEYNSYDVKFIGEKFYLAFDYDGNELTDFSLAYHYPGTEDLETAGELLDYKITSRDREAADKILDEVMSSFQEKYGDPKVFNSKVDTTTYTWVINDRMIELYDYTDNDDMGSMFGAFSIDVNCDHQSFCEHSDTEKESALATCTEDGYDRSICNICGYIDETVHKAFGHTESSKTLREPTCSVKGEKEIICSTCGNQRKEEIATIPHTYQDTITKEATCTTEGSKKQTCSVCSHTTAEEATDVLGHDYKQSITKSAGCETTGTYTYACTRCNDKYTETISALGHSMSSATCTQAAKCSRCGKTGAAALGHNWKDSALSVTCTRCSAKHTGNVSLSYSLPYTNSNGSVVVQSASISSSRAYLPLPGSTMDEMVVAIDVTFKGTCSEYSRLVYGEVYNSAGQSVWSICIHVEEGSFSETEEILVDANQSYTITFWN